MFMQKNYRRIRRSIGYDIQLANIAAAFVSTILQYSFSEKLSYCLSDTYYDSSLVFSIVLLPFYLNVYHEWYSPKY